MWERLRVWLGRWCVGRYGFTVVRATPANLLPSRVDALRVAVEKSGHLGHRYHLRRTLRDRIAEVADCVSRL
jgi:hypothetical protein